MSSVFPLVPQASTITAVGEETEISYRKVDLHFSESPFTTMFLTVYCPVA